MIDLFEGRDVATADVAGAYLKAQMSGFILMKFTGNLVDILCNMNPDHLPNIAVEKGTKVLNMRLVKALYGCVKSAMLWYDLFTGTHKDPNDPCITNAVIKGKQCTIAWYVEVNKISRVDPEVVMYVVKKLESKFEKITVTRGKEHVFLGMNITYTDKDTAVISMKGYLSMATDKCGMGIEREAATPAKNILFVVDAHAKR
jgi:hypothetical protein